MRRDPLAAMGLHFPGHMAVCPWVVSHLTARSVCPAMCSCEDVSGALLKTGCRHSQPCCARLEASGYGTFQKCVLSVIRQSSELT